jgi:LmbE family N-acetylglucosaminyl deacetylase
MKLQDFPPLRPKVILGIAAHPDDLDFGASGTMAKFARGGAEIHYLIITDGGKGSKDKAMTPAKLTALRQAEQRAALKELGGTDVQFLNGFCDGELEVTMALKKELVKAIRIVKPDVVVTMDPSMIYSARRGFINHPDHRAAGQATLDAIFPLARDHMSFPDLFEAGHEPHITATALLINFDHANFAVDITDTFEQKMAALKAHDSQISDINEVRKWVEDTCRENGEQAGCELAEAFVRIDIR